MVVTIQEDESERENVLLPQDDGLPVERLQLERDDEAIIENIDNLFPLRALVRRLLLNLFSPCFGGLVLVEQRRIEIESGLNI